jgi:hypothetical protein
MRILKFLIRSFLAILQQMVEFVSGMFRRMLGVGSAVPMPPAVAPLERTTAPSPSATNGPTLAGLELASMVRRVAHRLLMNRDASELLATLPSPIARDLRIMRQPDLQELLREDLSALAARLTSGRVAAPAAPRRTAEPSATAGPRHVERPTWDASMFAISPRGP